MSHHDRKYLIGYSSAFGLGEEGKTYIQEYLQSYPPNSDLLVFLLDVTLAFDPGSFVNVRYSPLGLLTIFHLILWGRRIMSGSLDCASLLSSSYCPISLLLGVSVTR